MLVILFLDKRVKAVFPVLIHTGGFSITDFFEETLSLEEAASLNNCFKKGIPIQQCRDLVGVCSRIEEAAVYHYALYESDSIDNMDSFQIEILLPDRISV